MVFVQEHQQADILFNRVAALMLLSVTRMLGAFMLTTRTGIFISLVTGMVSTDCPL